MKITVKDHEGSFKVNEHAIRDKHDSDDGEVLTHFEAIVQDMRKSRETTLVCHIKYEDEEGRFLGLDEQTFYTIDDLSERFIEVPIHIPNDTAQLTASFKEAKHSSFVDRHEGLLISGILVVITAVIVLAAKGLFGWS